MTDLPGQPSGAGRDSGAQDSAAQDSDDIPAVSAESLVDGEATAEEPRTYPSTIGGGFYLVLLVVAAFALVLVVVGPWRTGIRVFGGVLFAAAALRLSLPARDAGMLAVRSKPVDAGLLTGVGLLVIFLAQSIPDQPV